MKNAIKIIALFSLLNFSNVYAQKLNYKVIKEEQLEDKDHDKTMYLITFKDGTKGKICKSPDGQYWMHRVLASDKGPFTKDEAIATLYKVSKEGADAAGQLGAGAAGALTHKKILVDQNGNKYYKDKNGKKVYVK